MQEVTQQLKALLAESKDTTSGPAGLHEVCRKAKLQIQVVFMSRALA